MVIEMNIDNYYIPAKRNLRWIILGSVSFVVLVALSSWIYWGRECSSNEQCPHDRVCASHKCADGCVGLCGPNTTCQVVNYVAMCACLPGYTGHPITGCEPTPPPPECSSNDHCPHNRVCTKHKCVEGCVGLCGSNTTCHVINHTAVCACAPGYTGHPITGCKTTPPPPESSQPASRTPLRKKRFHLNNDRSVDWDQASVNCMMNSTQLASVGSAEELMEINHLIMESGVRQGRYWTSGSDADQEGIFIWKSSGKPISMTTGLWMEGEPNSHGGTNENCVELWEKYPHPDYPIPGYFLNDVPCSMEFNYICEYYEEAL